jgi:hypothetical protein
MDWLTDNLGAWLGCAGVLVSLLLSMLAVWYARRSVEEAHRARLVAARPTFTLEQAGTDTLGPRFRFRSISEDLDEVTITLMQDPTGVNQDPPIAGIRLDPHPPAQRLELGPMKINESVLLAVSFYRRRDAVALRLRVEACKGLDRWVAKAECDIPAEPKVW